MLYIALAITTLLTMFYGIAYNEQKLKTEHYRKLSKALLWERIQESSKSRCPANAEKKVHELNLF